MAAPGEGPHEFPAGGAQAAPPGSASIASFGAFRFDAESGLLFRDGDEIVLPPRVSGVLECLLERAGMLVSREELLDRVWEHAHVADSSLSEAVATLRQALGDDPRRPTYVETIHRRGYRFIAAISSAPVEAEGTFGGDVATTQEAPRAGEAGAAPEAARVAVGGRLGDFEILGTLGSGAMGAVYRARDTTLGREVAIKVLPGKLVADPEWGTRLEREARLLASVSHPNIASIYSLEETDGIKFSVLELVEGETLDQRLGHGPMGVTEALETARQISSALEAAHERAIVHRDLKPANVKLTPEGQAKVLDFGLAKGLQVKPLGDYAADSPTDSMTIVASGMGSIVGTAAYMSPEQARGHEVDKRADIWAFGCVLYEMLTGNRAFEGETVSGTIASLLEREPDWSELPVAMPPTARALLHRCLSKDPRNRLHDIADARIEVEEVLGEIEAGSPGVASVAVRSPLWRRALGWGAAAALGALVAGLALWRLGILLYSAPTPVSHLLINVEPGQHLWGGHIWEISPYAFQRPSRSAFAFSPDGSYLVYAATADDAGSAAEYVQRGQLYLRWMNQPQARPIPGTESGACPFVSPDGEWIGFFQEGEDGFEIRKVAAAGGEPRTIVEPVSSPAGPHGTTWGDNGTILFADGKSGGLLRVSASGGSPTERATILDRGRGETSHRLPQMLPGSRAALFTVVKGRNWEEAEIAVLSLESGGHEVLIEDGSDARYVPTGHIVFVRRGTLMAVPFDAESLEVTEEPSLVLEDVMQAAFEPGQSHNTGAGQFSISDSGLLAHVPGGIHPELERSLVWVDREGNAEPLAVPPGEYRWPRLSPDGQQLAYTEGQAGAMNIWIYDVQRQTRRRLTREGENFAPVWSPDGTRIVFSSTRHGPVPNLYWMSLDGGQPERLTTSDQSQMASSWSVDEVLAFVQEGDVWVLPLDEESEPRPIVSTSFGEGSPAFSPDGNWIAYNSDETDRKEVYVQPYPGPGPPVPVSTEGGGPPAWSRDGGELFYRAVDALGSISRRMKVADVVAGQRFDYGEHRILFEVEYVAASPVRSYDVTRSGQLVMVTFGDHEMQRVTQIHIVLNWFEELKRLVPTER